MKSNPLYKLAEFPAFDKITPAHAEPAIDALLADAEKAVAKIEKTFAAKKRAAAPTVSATWENRVAALSDANRALWRAWGVIGHLTSVCDSKEWREAEEKILPKIVAFSIRVSQSEPLYASLLALRDSPCFAALDSGKRRVIDAAILAAKNSGIALEGKKRETFNGILQSLSKLSTKFSNNVQDATKVFSLKLSKKSELAGLPPTVLAATKQKDGTHKITLEHAVYLPFMKYSTQRKLREKLYKAQVSRASEGKLDNAPVIEKILAKKRRLARLLGYDNYAQISLSEKMAGAPANVYAMIDRIGGIAVAKAKDEFASLEQFAGRKLKPWDQAFWATRQGEALFGFSSETLRPYFQFEKVLDGLFALTNKLFGATVKPADGDAPVWHPDVRFFRVENADGAAIASFYLDPYSRPESKHGGAWMKEFQSRRVLPDGSAKLPIGLMVCNQAAPAGGRPSCMTLGEVSTLFHEFGHTLQHILTQVDIPEASGINNIEWDAVELASQFMENWVTTREMLEALSSHVETGEKLPSDLIDKILASSRHHAAIATARQLSFAFADMELHTEFPAGKHATLQSVAKEMTRRFAVIPPVKEDRFLNSFSHIFAGGYSAGYYSYMWADILAADAFGAFEEAGLQNAAKIKKLGRKYAGTVLALGGSLHPGEVFRLFRDRDPDPAALLRQKGLQQ